MIAIKIDRAVIKNRRTVGKNEIDIATDCAIFEVGATALRVKRILIT